ncbi:MAG: hypothetical protein IJM83_03195, partial [Firmicutes bacterium]|nr:hypothetical protein [Bacillota bacterium]
MSQRERILNYLKDNYRSNEPIFLSEISIPDIKPSSLRLQMKRLTEDGIIRRFDTGIYYLPAKTMFRFVSSLSPDEVIRKKFLYENGSCCGYVSGMMFANQLGLTTQVPLVYEVYTNKATTDYR